MKSLPYYFLLLTIILAISNYPATNNVFAQSTAQITLIDKDNKETTSIVDGNRVLLEIELDASVSTDTRVEFLLADTNTPIADCTIRANERSCKSTVFTALGWYWNTSGTPQPQRTIRATINGQPTGNDLIVSVAPRPVVMVHGFNSTWQTWSLYIGPQGYLQTIGLHGYAVGDGQVNGVMNTGSLSDPAARTNTIAENAEVLGQYIDNVKTSTGAEKVDLLVHSMGGMISRYYIDRLMNDADAAQLIILGTPMAGSDCANLPAALGLLLPATIEIQPSYMAGIFNQQIYRRHGVPFHALAGTKLLKAVQSPCTPVPSDVVVTIDSVKAIPMPVQEIALLHTDLTTAPEVFDSFVKPLLQTPPGNFKVEIDPLPGSTPLSSGQFSKVYTGHINPGESQDVIINIDAGVNVANFAMYDTTRSLTTTVTGASGKQIELDNEKNGVIRVDDPSTLVYLGYGFNQPKPGKWIIAVAATDATPPQGADYAITAQFNGGAILTAKTDTLLPKLNQPVLISADLKTGNDTIQIITAQARVTKPDGTVDLLEMNIEANNASLEIQTNQAGLHGVEINVTSKSVDGFHIDRAAFLAFEVQPSEQTVSAQQIAIIAGVVVAGAVILMIFIYWRKRRLAQ